MIYLIAFFFGPKPHDLTQLRPLEMELLVERFSKINQVLRVR